MAGISSVFTIVRVAEMLGGDEDCLHKLSMELDPEVGCLWVHDINDREVQAFPPYSIECLQQIIADKRAVVTQNLEKPSSACCVYRMPTIRGGHYRFTEGVLACELLRLTIDLNRADWDTVASWDVLHG